MNKEVPSFEPNKINRRKLLAGAAALALGAGAGIQIRNERSSQGGDCLPQDNRVYTPFESVRAVDNNRVAEIGFANAVAEQEASCEED